MLHVSWFPIRVPTSFSLLCQMFACHSHLRRMLIGLTNFAVVSCLCYTVISFLSHSHFHFQLGHPGFFFIYRVG